MAKFTDSIRDTFSECTLFQKIEFVTVTILAFVTPISWNLATKILVLWILCAVIRRFADRKTYESTDFKGRKRFFLLFAAFYIMYCISMLYTRNTAEGLACLEKKLSFLILPIMFAFFDFSYLGGRRFRMLAGAFVASLFTIFCYDMATAAFDVLARNADASRFFDHNLSVQHHAYISMYFCLGIAFCFKELFDVGKSWRRNFLPAVLMVCFSVFVILLSSRAGILCMIAMYAMLLAWLTFSKKKYRLGLSIAGIAVVGIAVLLLALPQATNRIVNTVKSVTSSEQKTDTRMVILGSTVKVAQANWLAGVGVGDRCDAYMRQYKEDGNDIAFGRHYNSHNQYIDTIASTGIIGLLLMLSFFVVPTALFFRDRKCDIVFLSFLFIIAFNALFESIFEVQSGIFFFAFFFALFFQRSCLEKPCQAQESKKQPFNYQTDN